MKPADRCTNIEEVRHAIDAIDEEVIQLLGRRLQYVKEIIKFKEPTEESVVAQKRFDSVIESRRELAYKNGLDQDLIERIYRELLNFFIAEEMKLIRGK
ncbi:MAG: chorismate mutase [Bacteroidales bacterium]|nr:chorismate mutase [Bacteroidales bacterium]